MVQSTESEETDEKWRNLEEHIKKSGKYMRIKTGPNM